MNPIFAAIFLDVSEYKNLIDGVILASILKLQPYGLAMCPRQNRLRTSTSSSLRQATPCVVRLNLIVFRR